jgi:hypothetical protein
MSQSTIDLHCLHIRESIEQQDYSLIECLNYLKNHACDIRTRSDWTWIGQQLVMSGWLSVDCNNDFILKVSAA